MIYFKYAFYSIVKKPLFNILVMIELAAILIVGNMTIAAANSRSMLSDPMSDFINKDGIVFYPKAGPAMSGGYDKDLTLSKTFENLKGKPDVFYNFSQSIFFNDERFFDPVFQTDSSFNLTLFDDRIFSKFALPLSAGRWSSGEKNDKNQVEVVAALGADGNSFNVGDVLQSYTYDVDENGDTVKKTLCDIVITGTIKKGDLYPFFSNYSNDLNITDLYDHNISSTQNTLFLASASADPVLSDKHNIGHTLTFITYNAPLTEQERQDNLAALGNMPCALTDMSDFRQRTSEYIFEQYIKLLPILLCVFVIVLSELMCSIAMTTKRQMRNYGIYYLCGCRWKDIVKISAANSAIILGFGAALGAVGVVLFEFTPYASLFEQNLDLNNIYLTLLIVLIMLIMSLIIPTFMLKRTQPVEIIREN